MDIQVLTYHSADVGFQVFTDAVVEEGIEARTESTGAGRTTDHILKDQIPTNEKGDKLAHRDVAVHIGRAAGFRYTYSEFGVA